MAEIIQKAQAYVQQLFDEKLPAHLVFHNIDHTLGVKNAVEKIALPQSLTAAEKEILVLGALLHDVGYTKVYDGHEEESMKMARNFLEKHQYPKEKLHEVLKLIEATKRQRAPRNNLEKIIRDADLHHLGRKDYFDILNNLRAEIESEQGFKFGDLEWFELNRSFLKKQKYFTEEANHLYADQVKANAKTLKKTSKQLDAKTSRLHVEKNISGNRTAQMMFKTALRNHIDLTNIADNKANIMLSINAIVITITMPLLASNIKGNMYLLPPTSILLLTCLLSIIFATLATRPIKTKGITNPNLLDTGQSNLFFFGNFYKMSINEYHNSLKEVVGSDDLLESSVMNDLYYLGVALGKKYNQLRTCYGIFMIGITLTVITFAVSFLTQAL